MTLEKMRQEARIARRQEKRDATFWAAFAVKYADENLKTPGNLDEAAVAVGRWMAEVARLKAKWGKKVPPAGTPEASEYQQDQEKLMTGMAAWGKFVADPNALAPLADPDKLAQFQTLSLSGALNLNEGQMQQIDAALSACLEDADARGLNTRIPPQTGAAAWNQARTELGRRAFNIVNAFLNPEQSAVFTDAYVGTQASLGSRWLGGPVVTLSKSKESPSPSPAPPATSPSPGAEPSPGLKKAAAAENPSPARPALSSGPADEPSVPASTVASIDDKPALLDLFRRRGYSIPEGLIDEQIATIVHGEFRDDRAAFLQAIQAKGYTEAGFRAAKREEVIVQAMRQRLVRETQEAKARAIILPRVQVRDWRLADTIELLATEVRRLNPALQRMNVHLDPSATQAFKDAKVTLDLSNVSLLDVLQAIAQQTRSRFASDRQGAGVAEKPADRTSGVAALFLPSRFCAASLRR